MWLLARTYRSQTAERFCDEAVSTRRLRVASAKPHLAPRHTLRHARRARTPFFAGGEEPRQWEAGGRGRERESPGATAASGASGGPGSGVGREAGFEKIRTRSRSHSMHMVDVSGECVPICLFIVIPGLFRS